ncbi:hypothetical protein [Streptomyces sp. MJM1172]|uniref:hypothetical protein n=1 Tax=Streptomyces sp. MJM1172 TaxID=1703926 RepID=UPI00093A528C|nr:hypothetical protein [Streptomyces sp. MJM1172]OKI71384.1 hypothetical protein AMK15_01790 [Streptomyces sp. MJM1172]
MEITLTVENIATAPLVGLIIEGAEDLGPIRAVRLAAECRDAARLSGDLGWDLFALPVTLTGHRAA